MDAASARDNSNVKNAYDACAAAHNHPKRNVTRTFRHANNAAKRVLIETFLRPWASAVRDFHVVDVGCGSGQDFAKVMRPFASLKTFHGFDFSPKSIVEARRRVETHNIHNCVVNLQTLDVTQNKLPVASGSAHAVLCMFAYHYFCRTRASAYDVLHEMSRVLVAGGHLLMVFPDADAVEAILDGSRAPPKTFAVAAAATTVRRDAEGVADTRRSPRPYYFSMPGLLTRIKEWTVHFPSLEEDALRCGLVCVTKANLSTWARKAATTESEETCFYTAVVFTKRESSVN